MAYLDVDANNRPDRGGSTVANGSFTAAADLTVTPATTTNRAVATQNLFFLNNVVHDKLYTLGFNELAGNFQSSNFGKGGAENDPVQAEAQDGGGTDNANFATPRDGRSPRMQMYLWTGAGATHKVHVNSPTPADYGAKPAEFGPALTVAGVTGALVAAVDAGGTSNLDGCEAITTPLAGKVALVNRGSCDFTVKALNAQAAGAIAIVVANNQAGEPVVMGGSNSRIKIPALMVSQADGSTLRGTANPNVTLSKLAVQPLQRDATLDSPHVAHDRRHERPHGRRHRRGRERRRGHAHER
jgi:extracellular elastinolytic metalloproteinase